MSGFVIGHVYKESHLQLLLLVVICKLSFLFIVPEHDLHNKMLIQSHDILT